MVLQDQWHYLTSLKRTSEIIVDQLIAGIPRSEGEEGDPTTEKVFDRMYFNRQRRYRASLFALKHDRMKGGSGDVPEAQTSMF